MSVLAVLVAGAAACSGSSSRGDNNANANMASRPGEIKLDPANMPPGLSGSPVPLTGDIPGIPVNAANQPKGTTPTPGIPGPEDLKKKRKPGTTPTPGIPDEETLRKALGYPTKSPTPKPKP